MKKLITVTSSTLLVFVMLMAVASVSAGDGCNVTVSAGEGSTAIQDAVNAASTGDKICLDGIFTTISGPGGTSEVNTITIGTSGITLKPASSAVLDGGYGPAFLLSDGVSNVTIEGLEIKNRNGFRGGGIQAWDVTTSNVTIRDNYLHHNTYNGVLVGSEGGYIHKNWMVRDNVVDNHGFAGIELTNCENCTIMSNSIGLSYIGILVQARNTIGSSVSIHINGVGVLQNTIDDAIIGIYVLAYEGLTGYPFTTVGATSLLTNVNFNNNTVNNSVFAGVLYRSYNPGSTANNGRINNNVVDCGVAAATGVDVREDGASGDGTVKNVKVVNNNFSSCSTDVADSGVGTKLPPGPGPF